MNLDPLPMRRLLLLAGLASSVFMPWGAAQEANRVEPAIQRPGPPRSDDLETDANGDGVPDGWYNARDAFLKTEGGKVGPRFIRFECNRRGRPARLSRAFGIDGRETGAIVLGLWVRVRDLQYGERVGEEPSLLIDFLGEELRHLSRGTMGPWTRGVGDRWTRVVKRIAVPPGTRDAIMSVGLLGAAGVLDIDGLTIDPIPVGEEAITNLVVNGDFELGDPLPAYWIVNNEVRRVFPGHDSPAAVEFSRSGARLLTGLALPVDGLGSLEVSLWARGQGMRASGGAAAALFFLDEFGQPLAGLESGVMTFTWSGSFGWRNERNLIRVPGGASRAVFQIEKTDSIGSILIDDVEIVASPNPELGSWAPFHVSDETDRWLRHAPSAQITEGSALDVSFLVPAPAEQQGFVAVRDGRLTFPNGRRARFHGVGLLPPTAFLENDQAEQLADRLARSGVNLVRLGDLDAPLGPGRSLFDDSRDDTRAFDPAALQRLDHLIAALRRKGIFLALELQSQRRFREEDGVVLSGLLPPGGGPAAIFDRHLRKLELDSARALLARVNPETGLALRDDPALAWVTLLGEVSLFDQIDRDDALPGDYAKALRALAQKSTSGTGRRFWQSLEADHHRAIADALRKDGLKAPIAGGSHWRREVEFSAAQASEGLDLIDDRLFWLPPLWIDPDLRSQLWNLEGSLLALAQRKRVPTRPYVAGQWCPQSLGAWAFPHEAADQLLAAHIAATEDWDALVRRGIFLYPLLWGDGPAGTVGGEDIYQIPEVVNATPQVYALWPHTASLLLRPKHEASALVGRGDSASRTPARRRGLGLPGWDPTFGRLIVETPYTQGIAGWFGGEVVKLADLEIAVDTPFAVIVASSLDSEPIRRTRRLLVTALGRVEPTGFRWVDPWKREVADPGRPPLLQEPIAARITWWRAGEVRGFALRNTGDRASAAAVEALAGGEGSTLTIEGQTAACHWELTLESTP
jgi:hypothetical protein